MLVVQFQQPRDVQLLRAVRSAVATRGTRQRGAFGHLRAEGKKRRSFLRVQRFVSRKGSQIFIHLRFIRHTGKDDRDGGDALQEAERPSWNTLIRTEMAQHCCVLLRQRRQFAAAQRFHDPDRDIPILQQRCLIFSTLELPVQPVQLELAKLHVLSISVQEAADHINAAMGGETEMADAAVALLFDQVGPGFVLRIVQILLDVQLADVVEEIEVKIVDLTPLKLFLKDLLRFPKIAEIVSGELVRQIEALSRKTRECFSKDDLRMPVVIAPGGVVVIDAAGHCRIDHAESLRLVDLRVVAVQYGQTHGTKSKIRQLDVLKCTVDHVFLLFHGADTIKSSAAKQHGCFHHSVCRLYFKRASLREQLICIIHLVTP